MPTLGSTARRRLIAALAAALFILVSLAARPYLERTVRARLESEATRRGLKAHIGEVHVGVWPPLCLRDVILDLASTGPPNAPLPLGVHFRADAIEAWWPGRTRLVVEHAVLEGPAGVTITSDSTTWDVRGLRGVGGREAERGAEGSDLHLALVQPQPGLTVRRTARHPTDSGASTLPHGDTWNVEATKLPVGGLLDVRRNGRLLLDGGTMHGSLKLEKSPEVLRFDLDGVARDARLPAFAGGSALAGRSELPSGDRGPATLGEPTDLALQLAGTWSTAAGSLEISRCSATIAGAEISGSLILAGLETASRATDPGLDLALALDVERLDFARLLRAAGVALPDDFGGAADLGTVRLVARAQGRTSDPASFTVTQQLDFTPPARMPPAIERLRGDFTHEVGDGDRRIDVSPASPDFIALADVPQLFLRALLLAEDAGFHGHRGIDLRELPSALLTDLARGGAARGASTITQQLAKNLFLSREKRLGRKLQELAVTFLLESALGKSRILEIYLNVIEWGPGLHGLRPAARTYFGREPRDLTPAQMAFLITLIPAPVKYQVSFAHGTPGPGLRGLMNDLLAKLRSVDAISEEEYQRALEEGIVVLGRE